MAAFDNDRVEVIQRAQGLDIGLINSGVDLKSNLTTKELSTYTNVFVSYGLSPPNYMQASPVIDFIRQNIRSACAIGEVGLDFYHVKQEPERIKQEQVLRDFLQLSEESGLPLVLHSRDAEERVFELVHNENAVIYHCYGGSVELAKKIVDCGHYISISTRICRSPHHKELVKALPHEYITIETDSPFLSCRKGRNEPAFVADALNAVSLIWEADLTETGSILVKNTKNAFDLA